MTEKSRSLSVAVVGLITAVVALVAGAVGLSRTSTIRPRTDAGSAVSSALLADLDKTNTIHAGYGVFPPYTVEDPKTGKVSGVSVEIIEELAREIGAKVEWRRLNWNTMGADLKRSTYNVVADPIFQTPQRAREFTFTEPYAYFPI